MNKPHLMKMHARSLLYSDDEIAKPHHVDSKQ